MDQTNQPPMPPSQKKPIGPVIGIIIIVLILILGGLYFWGEKLNLNNGYQQTTEETSDAQTDQLNEQSSSDNLSAIEADLKNTDTANLDAGLEGAGL